MSILDAIKNPKVWLVEHVVGGVLKNAAEGKYGPKVKAVYWWLYHYSAQIGAGFLAVDYFFVHVPNCAACLGYDHALWVVAGALMSLGFGLGIKQSETPDKPATEEIKRP